MNPVRLLGVATAAWLAGCTTTGTGFERDVAQTPRYAENKVYFVPSGSQAKPVALKPQFEPLSRADGKTIRHGDPLTIVVNSVAIPPEPNNPGLTRDIAVILDLAASTDGTDQSIVVFYQRGVKPDQLLNFSNLIVYYEPSWDSRVAPYFRMRLVDVATESNRDTRAMLETVAKSSNSLAALVPGLDIGGTLTLAARAAQLVLGNRNNTVLIDYSVQFYSQTLIEASGDAGLGELRRGAFLVLGRPERCGEQPCGRSYWNNQFSYFAATGQVFDKDSREVIAPYMSVSVVTAESIVPKLVIERSANLLKLLTATQGSRVEEIDASAKDLTSSLTSYVVVERVKRYRRPEQVQAAVLALAPQARKEDNLAPSDQVPIYALLSQIAGQSIGSYKDAEAWWGSVKNCPLDRDKLKFTCP